MNKNEIKADCCEISFFYILKSLTKLNYKNNLTKYPDNVN